MSIEKNLLHLSLHCTNESENSKLWCWISSCNWNVIVHSWDTLRWVKYLSFRGAVRVFVLVSTLNKYSLNSRDIWKFTLATCLASIKPKFFVLFYMWWVMELNAPLYLWSISHLICIHLSCISHLICMPPNTASLCTFDDYWQPLQTCSITPPTRPELVDSSLLFIVDVALFNKSLQKPILSFFP